MKQKLVAFWLFITAITTHVCVSNASAVELDDLMSPAEIAQEVVFDQIDAFGSSDERSGLWQQQPQIMSSRSKKKGAKVYIVVDKSQQRLYLYIRGSFVDSWLVSTGANRRKCAPTGRCYFASTPEGTYRPRGLSRRHRSKLWRVRMDYAIWIVGGIALHSTNLVSQLGRPVSGGCIRQSPRRAAYLFNIVKRYGLRNTRVKIRR